jgi:hypothetical protein
MGTVRALGRDQPLSVRIASSRALGMMCTHLDKSIMVWSNRTIASIIVTSILSHINLSMYDIGTGNANDIGRFG